MKKYIIIHILFLFVIQWASIAVIILNALALSSVENLESEGYVMINSREFVSIFMGAISLLVASIFLCFYIRLCFNILQSGDPVSPSTRLLGCEVLLSICVIGLWMSYNIVLVSNFNTSSACRHLNTELISKITSSACSLVDSMITVGFITICLWFLVLLLSIYTLLELDEHPEVDLLTTRSTIHPFDEKCTLSFISVECRQFSTSKKGSRATIVSGQIMDKRKSIDFLKDIQFKPIQVDLKLPSTSELLERDTHYRM